MASSRDRDSFEDTAADAIDPPRGEARGALMLPRETTPTWEVELLISGVAVFAMLQLPGWLDDRFFALRPRLSSEWIEPLKLVYVYCKSAALILAATFVLHLILRARWIALVGMHSVYPSGLRWESLRIGPVQRSVARERVPDMSTAIERADNFSTTVFALGVSLATILLVVSLGAVTVFAASALLFWWLRVPVESSLLGLGTLALLAPFLLAAGADRHFGDRLHPAQKTHALLRFVFALYSRVGIGRTGNPALALISSHGGERRMIGLTTVLMLVTMSVAALGYRAESDPLVVGTYELFPRSETGDSRFVDPAHYDNLRNPSRDPAVPFVQSDLPREDFLRLLIPYLPEIDGPILREGCSKAFEAAARQRRSILLECLQKAHDLTLDGKPLAGLRYELSSDPRTERPALLAMIDLRSLSPGRHELTVAMGSLDAEQDADMRQSESLTRPGYRIPFWH